jgi:hypothetical protein
MANEKVSGAAASARDVTAQAPSPFQDCSDVLHISVFFDGTGNNKDADEASKKWSNPARIWRSSQLFAGQSPNTYPVYVAGVGTPFNGKALSALDALNIKVEDSDVLGMGTGAGGTRRLGFGRQEVNDALRNALLTRAKALGGQVEQYAQTGKQKGFADVNRALRQHRLIKQINVSIFGFSRGAALARAFCNQWLWDCKDDRGELLYEGHPIRFVFLGLFDTVASFGLPATNLANAAQYGGFKGRDLVIDDRVERCVHYVAGHELRFAFPVDLIRHNGALAGNWVETVYPGVHSDVGGGYAPDDQGIDNNYARVPMRDMMREGLMHGVRIRGYDNLAADPAVRALFQERFECKPDTEAAYKAYRAACSPSGTVEQCVAKHMEHLYSAYGTLHREGRENVTHRQHREGKSWALGPKDMATELANYEASVRSLSNPLGSAVRSVRDPTYVVRQGAYAMWIAPQAWQLDAWKRQAAAGVASFVERFVHDSKVGFLKNAEPFSYFSQRGITESTRSVSGWFEANVARPADRAVESATDYVGEKVDQAQQAAREAADAAEQKARQAAAYAAEQAKRAQAAAEQAARRAGDAIGNATQQAVEGLGAAWKKLGW